MTGAYLDSSWLVAILFGEPGWKKLTARLAEFDRLLSSNLLEAEVRSALTREQQSFDASTLTAIHWVVPDRALSTEIGQVLNTGYLWGADLWHVASALFATSRPSSLAFLTLDEQQGSVAGQLGFQL